jgi:hypothetical protein
MSKLSKTLEGRISYEIHPCPRMLPIEIPNIGVDISRIDSDINYTQTWIVEAKWETEFQVTQEELCNNKKMIELHCKRLAKEELNEAVFGEFRTDLILLQRILTKYGYDSEVMQIVQNMERRMFNE